MRARKQGQKPPMIREPLPRLLAFDPTPAGLVARSLPKAFKGLWASLRKAHFATSPPVCEICSDAQESKRLIQGHEVYAFPSPTSVRLTRVKFVCYRCHDAIHFERTRRWCGET
jgi:hypothetical protein